MRWRCIYDCGVFLMKTDISKIIHFKFVVIDADLPIDVKKDLLYHLNIHHHDLIDKENKGLFDFNKSVEGLQKSLRKRKKK